MNKGLRDKEKGIRKKEKGLGDRERGEGGQFGHGLHGLGLGLLFVVCCFIGWICGGANEGGGVGWFGWGVE